LAVGFLFLAWPAPYSSVLLGVLNAFTSATISLLNGIVHVIPVATVSGPGIYTVTHAGTPFVLSVISACSGVDSVVGFLLVGGCFSLIVKGRFLRKVLWMAIGMALVWGFNLFRLTFIFFAGRMWGQGVALGVFHPFIGLFLFAVAIVAMMAFMRPLGLSLAVPGPAPSFSPKRAIAVPKLHAAAILMLAVASILGSVDAGLSAYNLVATSSGEPTLTSFDVNPNLAPPNFVRRYVTQVDWATPYFGEDSTWKRYVYTDAEAAASKSAISISEPIWADVIDTKSLESFSAYGIEACYQFHGYTLSNISDVNLGGGIRGQTLSYQTGTSEGSWSIVYWIVPVTAFGVTSYERVVLYVQDSNNVAAVAPSNVSGVSSLSGALGATTPQARSLVANRNFLVLFARSLIQLEAKTKTPVLAASSASAA
jgi:exosortase/archaeosortase family protein